MSQSTVPLQQKALRIDLASGAFSQEGISPDSGILGPVDFGWQAFQKDPEVFTFGEGPLASSAVPGARRLVMCAWSPQWESFYVTSMGGAAYTFQHVGVNYVALHGRCAEPSVLLLNNDGDAVSVKIVPLRGHREIWCGYKGPEGESLVGIHALQQAIFDRWGKAYPERRVRVFVVGPAAETTQEGAIASNTMKKGRFLPVVDWCGRGGMGSRLFQAHNLLGCLFGGNWEDPHAASAKDTDPFFVTHYGKKGVKVDQEATVKYRYDPKIQTGGTFGSNLHGMGDKIMTFNYRSVLASNEARSRQHRDFIRDHYLKQFNEETIAPKAFDHCGEPCAVACKKLRGKYKKDYEPYHALGPQVGVFDQRAAEFLNEHADAMGMDAIQTGGTLAWIMECIATDLFPPEDFGFPPKTEMTFAQFTADKTKFDLVRDSWRNARYAVAVIDTILFDPRAALFRQGIRAAARELDRRYPETRPSRVAVYLAHGENGHMVPNQYWVPGMGSPMPIMGKYYVDYSSGFTSPEDLGRKNVARMVYEIMSDNGGLCRFHRKWGEPMLGILVNGRFGLSVDYKRHHYALAQQINAREGQKGHPWETERMGQMFLAFLKYWGGEDPQGELAQWIAEAEKDPLGAAQAFWHKIKAGQDAAFAEGPQAIPDALTPAQEKEQAESAASAS